MKPKTRIRKRLTKISLFACFDINQTYLFCLYFAGFYWFLGGKSLKRERRKSECGSCQLICSLLAHKVCGKGIKIITAFSQKFNESRSSFLTNTHKKSYSFKCFQIENPFLIEFHFRFSHILELETTAIFTTGEHEFQLKTAFFLPLYGI
jgi:hypothetical protein